MKIRAFFLCLHEDHSVAIAHGYARVTGEPMACVLHANVGLLHDLMAMFHMPVHGAHAGPGRTVRSPPESAAPGSTGFHTMRDQASLCALS